MDPHSIEPLSDNFHRLSLFFIENGIFLYLSTNGSSNLFSINNVILLFISLFPSCVIAIGRINISSQSLFLSHLLLNYRHVVFTCTILSEKYNPGLKGRTRYSILLRYCQSISVYYFCIDYIPLFPRSTFTSLRHS